jgi:glycosyltransferase involved in cell wall biosynthesis
MSRPTISVVIPAYNAERFIAEAVTAVLSQTRPPEEVIVVDDGSTDGTLGELSRFGSDIQVVTQRNAGAGGAYTRGFGMATGTYVARCDADDVWELDKLGRQQRVLEEWPGVDIAFGAAMNFGVFDGPWDPPPYQGVLDTATFARDMYRCDFVCASTAIVRRSLFEELGAFVGHHPCEDYEYWLRALKHGAVFYYDPVTLIRYRRHTTNVTNDLLRMYRGIYQVHGWHTDLVDDPRFVRGVLADDRFRIAQWLYDNGAPQRARRAFVAALRHRPAARELGWAIALSAPERYRRTMLDGLVSLKHSLSGVPAG